MQRLTTLALSAAVAGTFGLIGAAGGSVMSANADTSSHPTIRGTDARSYAKVDSVTLPLRTSSPELDDCFPHARAKVKVDLTTDDIGKDTFRINARGLRPRTDFTVFLIQKAGAPFGHVEYIGDFSTNRWGRGHNTFTLIAEEAFAFNNATGNRADLNKVGFWFADPRADNGCLGAGSPVTGFDGDASAGVQMMNSGTHKLP
ncbi:MAG TPA: hypothetical protein VH419_11580 [Nocardioidaceae bacterium]